MHHLKNPNLSEFEEIQTLNTFTIFFIYLFILMQKGKTVVIATFRLPHAIKLFTIFVFLLCYGLLKLKIRDIIMYGKG